jgi:ribosomal protein S12 methylthiotransferase
MSVNGVPRDSANSNMAGKKVHFVSLGCPKNLVDSEIMAASLMGHGYQVVGEAEGADTVVVNTCGFIEDAKRESVDKILEMGDLKSEGKLRRLVVAGCLSQRYKDELVEGLPEADLFIGSGEFQNIAEILNNNDAGSETRTFFNLPTYLQEETTPRVNSQPSHRAFLKISEGCKKRCAFCAIPKIRGNLQSRRLGAVLSEAKLLAAGGVRELIVISHDFTDYGWDLRRHDTQAKESPLELLRQLGEVSGIDWVRVLYLYPDGVTPELVALMKDNPRILPYFDMPLQHINDQVLARMNRKMTRAMIEEAIARIRRELPEAVIRTQFIVGFPGETEENFEELLSFVKDQKFDRVGCFQFSPEEGTPAGRMLDTVDEATKESRYHRLMAAQKKISRSKQRAMVGKILEVVVEGLSEESELFLQGRTAMQAPDIDGIVLINEGTARVGQVVRVQITDATDYDLVGGIVDSGEAIPLEIS